MNDNPEAKMIHFNNSIYFISNSEEFNYENHY